ncbi:MAG TPA: YceI family protein [Rhizomicrobium sp.]
MKKIALSLGVLLSTAAPASAAQHWAVDYSKSKVGFTVQWNGEPFTAVFRSWKADIDFDPADPAHARAQVNIDLASEASDDPQTDDGVKGAEGFQVSQFSTATFLTTAFTHKSGNQYIATGTLSIKGISRAITLPFTFTLSGNTAHVVGHAQVVRTDFKVGTGEWAKPDPVATNVTVNIDLTATKGR